MTVEDQRQQIMELYTDKSITAEVRDALLFDLNSLPKQEIVQQAPTQYKIDLVPGKYSLDETLLYNGGLRIPREVREFCKGVDSPFGCIGSTEEIVLKEKYFKTWISGGAKIEFELDEIDVYNDNTLVLYVFEMPLPRTWTQMEDYETIEKYQEGKTYLIRPKIE